MTVPATQMALFHAGLDEQSLYGTTLSRYKQSVWIGANGHNIYNGMLQEWNINTTTHENILAPELLNTNMGLSMDMDVTDTLLATSGVAYDAYRGIVYVYKRSVPHRKWFLLHRIEAPTLSMDAFGSLVFWHHSNLFVTSLTRLHQYSVTDTHVFLQTTSELPSNHFLRYLQPWLIYSNMEGVHRIYPSNTTITNNPWIRAPPQDISCLFGSFVHATDTFIWVSCGLPTRSQSVCEWNEYITCTNILPRVFVYQTQDGVATLVQTLYPPKEEDVHFGSHLDATDNQLAIAGTEQVYYYQYTQDIWILTQLFQVEPNTYDYVVQFVPNQYSLLVGCYQHDQWRGAVFIAPIQSHEPSILPSTIQHWDIFDRHHLATKVWLVVALVLGGAVITLSISILSYGCVMLCTPVDSYDKKKKKLEEEATSPYQVHSYLGYIETDDVPEQPPYPRYVAPVMWMPPSFVAPFVKEKKEKQTDPFPDQPGAYYAM